MLFTVLCRNIWPKGTFHVNFESNQKLANFLVDNKDG